MPTTMKDSGGKGAPRPRKIMMRDSGDMKRVINSKPTKKTMAKSASSRYADTVVGTTLGRVKLQKSRKPAAKPRTGPRAVVKSLRQMRERGDT